MIRKSRLYFLSSPGIEPERGLFVLSSVEAVYDTGIEFFLGGHFEVRELRLLEGPFEEGQTVRIRGSATCRAEGVPDLELVLEEIVTSEGERIIQRVTVMGDVPEAASPPRWKPYVRNRSGGATSRYDFQLNKFLGQQAKSLESNRKPDGD